MPWAWGGSRRRTRSSTQDRVGRFGTPDHHRRDLTAGVAEAGTRPESTLAFSTRDEPLKKIATTISISDEPLEDGAAVGGASC